MSFLLGISWFSSVIQANAGSDSKQATTPSFQSLSNSPFAYYPIIGRYIAFVTENES
jgi:hypothetical protein